MAERLQVGSIVADRQVSVMLRQLPHPPPSQPTGSQHGRCTAVGFLPSQEHPTNPVAGVFYAVRQVSDCIWL